MPRTASLCLVLALFAGHAAGSDINFSDPRFTPSEFADLSETLADAMAFPLGGGAAPLGLVGFDVLAVAGGPKVSESTSWWKHAVHADTVGGILTGGRLIARKGLPLQIDLGVQYGTVLGERLVGAEARWALLAGSVVGPALGVRASYSKLDNAPLKIEVSEAQLELSKGFAVLTPYAAAGVRRVESNAIFGDPAPRLHGYSHDTFTGTAGLRFSLPPFRFIGEVRQAERTSYFAGFGIGL